MTTLKQAKKKVDLCVESWYRRTLPMIDLDAPVKGKWPEYRMTEKAWVASVKKDVEKLIREALKATELEEEKTTEEYGLTNYGKGFNKAVKLQKQKIKDYLKGVKER